MSWGGRHSFSGFVDIGSFGLLTSRIVVPCPLMSDTGFCFDGRDPLRCTGVHHSGEKFPITDLQLLP